MNKYVSCFLAALLGAHQAAIALTFNIEPFSDIIGELQSAIIQQDESLGDIGRRFNIGVYEMIEANPLVDPWVPEIGHEVIIPSQFILPPGPRTGIVMNLAEMRLYYYWPDKKQVSTYPIGIGRREWPTPLGLTKITSKIKDPAWHPPQSIRAEHALKGDILPLVIPAGPDNPLGQFAFRMGMASVLLHGTNKPGGVGLRSSHGCIRLLPADIAELFKNVAVGTPVRIIHTPYKLGWHEGHLYLESHKPLREARFKEAASILKLTQAIEAMNKENHTIDWPQAAHIATQSLGFPIKLED